MVELNNRLTLPTGVDYHYQNSRNGAKCQNRTDAVGFTGPRANRYTNHATENILLQLRILVKPYFQNA